VQEEGVGESNKKKNCRLKRELDSAYCVGEWGGNRPVKRERSTAAAEGVRKYIATRVGRRPSCSGAHKSRIGIPWRTRGHAMKVASPTSSWKSDRESETEALLR
jgi:hypothetical protein